MEKMSDRNEAWRKATRDSLPPRERMAIERVKMPEVAPARRVACRELEVNEGLTPGMARREACRCLDCVVPTCVEGCPVGVDIPGFVKEIERGEFLQAAAVLRRASALPAVCGRVCPQERQCEERCVRAKRPGGEAVAIGHLERFAADAELASGAAPEERVTSVDAARVAVIGSGPSGLSCAGDLARAGVAVTVFEALHEIGGVLKYGIPGFRLPNGVVDEEVDRLRRLGVRFVTNFVVGMTGTVEQLRAEGFCRFYVSSGAGLPRFMGIPGENYNGVLSSNEYLTRVNLMGAGSAGADTPVYRGGRVVVVGGGNTAMDSARTALRLGAERVTVVYRRGEREMPARVEEVRHAREEGCEFLTLTNPVAYLADARGRVRQVMVQRMELGEADEDGRRSPVAVAGSEHALDADMVVVAVGVSPNPIIPASVPGLDVSRRGTITVDPVTMRTSVPDIYAGGDIVRGGATVILAMGDGRRAARGILDSLPG
ncbi:MAG: NADPH-dependent glutamate synthase [Odoribacteraceae bacterium]|jgi:glutamate synthase (NADPH/NADH) small chain|nr:NADPH-dependent glutamate synthase [Odoribacteraceae bacterium]